MGQKYDMKFILFYYNYWLDGVGGVVGEVNVLGLYYIRNAT